MMVGLGFLMVLLAKFRGEWYITLFRFILLFSSIIPISLRVNLDLAKTWYSFAIMRDKRIPGTIVRTSTIPEELGRINYLLSDKTGTLTRNEMVFKKLHLGNASFGKETLEEIRIYFENSYQKKSNVSESTIFSMLSSHNFPCVSFLLASKKLKRTMESRVSTIIHALALAHNVTPNHNEDGLSYQASSPDEIALVKFTERIGLKLWKRDLKTITLKNPLDELQEYKVLNIFPFTSETKRMGIIVKEKKSKQITFFMKGADVVMSKIG